MRESVLEWQKQQDRKDVQRGGQSQDGLLKMVDPVIFVSPNDFSRWILLHKEESSRIWSSCCA
jgi:hypothetical protein